MNMIFKFIKHTDIRILLICLAAMLLLAINASGQCTLVCASDINVTINPHNCEAHVDAASLTTADCNQDFYIQIMDYDRLVADGTNTVVINEAGHFIYKISIAGQSPCWGNIHVEDKNGPVYKQSLDIDPITLVCGELSADPSGNDDLKTELVSCVVEDKGHSIEPWFDILEANDFLDCEEVVAVYNLTEVEDYCDSDIEIVDVVIPSDWLPYKIYTRYWYAEDNYGRLSDTVSQTVITLRPKNHLIRLNKFLELECGEDPSQLAGPFFVDLSNGADFLTCPQSSGKRVYLPANDLICGYTVTTNSDAKIAICSDDVDETYKQNTYWNVIDWCTGRFVIDNERQLVEVKDNLDPIVIPGSVDFKALGLECEGVLTVGPAITSGDECTGLTWTTIVEYGEMSYENGYFERLVFESNGVSDLPIPSGAEVKITWIAEDACENIGQAIETKDPLDVIPPVCIANDLINVSLIIDDPILHTLAARIYAEDVDDTSYDNCQNIVRLIRRHDHKLEYLQAGKDIDELWAPYIEFTHEDLKNGACETEHLVDLLIVERRRGGLRTECSSRVLIENKTLPIAKAPEDIKVSCKGHIPSFGNVELWGACNNAVDVETKVLIDDRCNYDTIYHAIRVWKPYTIVDGARHYGIADTQSIVVYNVHDVNFNFPLDRVIDCSEENTLLDTLHIDEILTDDGCGQWKMTVTDKTYASTEGADCKKIIREYEFINWCTWEYDRTEVAVVGRPDDLLLEDGSEVKLVYRDVERNRINDIDDQNDGDIYDESSKNFDGIFVRIDNPDGVGGIDTYQENVSGEVINFVDGYLYGRFVYRQIFKIEDNNAPELDQEFIDVQCDPNADCELIGDVKAKFVFTDDCSDVSLSYLFLEDGTDELKQDPYGQLVDGVITGKYPTGEHEFVVTARDGCNNVTTKSFNFMVTEECKKPTPVCLATFTALMRNGSVEIWATDVESGSSFDNCTDYAELEFAIQKVKDLNGDKKITSEDVNNEMPEDRVIYLDCDDLSKAFVALWVRDKAGNTQYCLTPVYITDNGGDCKDVDVKATVSGAITNEVEEEIDEVMIKIEGAGIAAKEDMFNGVFNFDVPMNQNISIIPEKDKDYLNGVSTADLVLLQRHILGVNELTSAYKVIAADASGDEKIDTRDMLHLSRLILGVYDELPNNKSWRFVDKQHQFDNPMAPWGFREWVELNDVAEGDQADFIGIKIGDVSGNAKVSNLLGDESKYGELAIKIEDQLLTKAASHTIDFKASDFSKITGFQFTLAFTENVEFVELELGELPNLSTDNFAMHSLEEGIITASWANVSGINLDDETVLFSLRVRTNEEVNVSDVISINSKVTSAEAYDHDLNVMEIKPSFIRSNATEAVLYQNAPNPFNGVTTIGFELPENDHIVLKVLDISGKTLSLIEGDYHKGYNSIEIASESFGATGVLYYELTTSHTTISKKMVVLK